MKLATGRTRKVLGFSLIELLVVVAIIGVLAAILYPNLNGSRSKARDAERVSDLGQLQLAFQLFYDRCGSYPASIDLTAATGCPSGVTLASFVSTIPTPPSGTTQTSAYDYQIRASGSLYNAYVLHAVMENADNAAVRKGLSTIPSWVSGTPFSCSNTSTSKDYCVGP